MDLLSVPMDATADGPVISPAMFTETATGADPIEVVNDDDQIADPGEAAIDVQGEKGDVTLVNTGDLTGDVGISVPGRPFARSHARVAGFAEDADNYLILVRATPGQPFTYYMGSAWDRGLDFHSREQWEGFVAAQAFDFGK